jgi:hypothetical protein
VQAVFRHAALVWVPLAVAVTGVSAAVYGVVQQDLRQGANDPQIEMAEDAAARLDGGAAPAAILPTEPVELSSSLRPYVMVFDRSRELVASSATLNTQPPPFPPSVFDNLGGKGQDRITWQPAPGVRSATVVQSWRGGFVVVGRSLRLVEERENQVLLLAALVWLTTLGATALAAVVTALLFQQSPGGGRGFA